MKNIKYEKDDLFENPFLKEYLFNLQVNQKLSMREFLFTKNVFKLIAFTSFLLWYNQESEEAIKYIIIGSFCFFLYLFKNSRVLKREKYIVAKDHSKDEKNQLILHTLYNKKIKNNLKEKFLLLCIAICIPDYSKADFVEKINESTITQIKNNNIYKNENDEMIRRTKIKNIMYLSQENKNFLTKQINEQIKVESDLEINIIKTKLEKSKNEIKK